ncbi:response regulator transcription factor [Pilimelia columellifera]|uniref:Response regulatory domain-containing protein n=1 Tax=Pilimelia columellifera subsp. columellifera TaxID=706583 RepID=A0ABN3NPZ7_9ACTN
MTVILVIDDDPGTCQLLTDALQHQGYSVQTAGDGLAGLRTFEAVHPDFVVLDADMPLLDGHAVLRTVRDRDGDPVPVLMLTAATPLNGAARAWPDGVDYCLTKPFTPDEVTKLVNSLVGAWWAENEQ